MKKIKDMKVGEILLTPEFLEQLGILVDKLSESRKTAKFNARMKAHPVDRLIARGHFKPGKLAVLYAEICNKTNSLPSSERNFIASLGSEAFNRAVRILIRKEDESKI